MSLSDRFDKVSAIKEDHILTAIDEMKEMGHNHQSEQEKNCRNAGLDRAFGRRFHYSGSQANTAENSTKGTVSIAALHERLKSVVED